MILKLQTFLSVHFAHYPLKRFADYKTNIAYIIIINNEVE